VCLIAEDDQGGAKYGVGRGEVGKGKHKDVVLHFPDVSSTFLFHLRTIPTSHLPLKQSIALSLFTAHHTKVTHKMRVAVIGGSPSGLTTLKYLTTAHNFLDNIKPIEAKLFATGASVGGTFKHRAYENAEVSCSLSY
jgi:hypothetical protein